MTTNLTATAQTAMSDPANAATLLGIEEDTLAGRGRMVCTRSRRYMERRIKPRYGARPDKAVQEPDPVDIDERRAGRQGGAR